MLMFSLFIVWGYQWQSRNLITGLIKTELLAILLPTLFLMFVIAPFRENFKVLSRLNATKFSNYLLIFCISLPLFITANSIIQLINQVFPLPESYIRAMEAMLNLDKIPFLQLILLMAVLPAICEEVLFRGFLINFFEYKGFRQSIFISGLLFAIFHLDPFRFIQVFLLGLWLGYILLKSNSLFLVMFAHFMNNFNALVLSKLETRFEFLDVFDPANFNPLPLIISIGFTLLLIFAFRKNNETTKSEVKNKVPD